MIRAGAFAAVILILAGCSQEPEFDSPYAPGVATRGETVDGLIVGHRLMEAGEFELAIDAFSRAALTHGITSDVLAGLGSANLGLGRLGQSEILLRKAIKKDERSPVIWNNLGVVLVEKGENAEAEQAFRRAFALDNGESDSIRDNLRLTLAKSEEFNYGEEKEQDYKLVRRGSSDYLIRTIP